MFVFRMMTHAHQDYVKLEDIKKICEFVHSDNIDIGKLAKETYDGVLDELNTEKLTFDEFLTLCGPEKLNLNIRHLISVHLGNV